MIKQDIIKDELQKTKGIIFDIRRMSLHDGPGIRTTVFLKGCNMDCRWCHNPESKNKNIEFMYDAKKCIMCKKCAEICSRGVHNFLKSKHIVDRNKCNVCGNCLKLCPTKAVEICGEIVTVREVLEIMNRDKIFYDVSNGGMTISGGEPLFQKEFTFSLLYEAKLLGINTIVDTNGYWNWDDIEKMLPYIDSFRYDLKIMDSKIHKNYTGVHNRMILENLKKLIEIKKDVIVVIPLIKGINDIRNNVESIILFLKTFSKIPRIQLLPYHSLYISKSSKLGKKCELFLTPEEKDIEIVKGKLASEGIESYDN